MNDRPESPAFALNIGGPAADYPRRDEEYTETPAQRAEAVAHWTRLFLEPKTGDTHGLPEALAALVETHCDRVRPISIRGVDRDGNAHPTGVLTIEIV